MTTEADTKEVVAALRDNDRFLVTTHENPDGDALGSLLAMHLALQGLGKDTVMYLGGAAPLPAEYQFLALDGLARQPPADHPQRVLVAVDCAQESRIVDPAVAARAPLTVNVDHHHDNTRFGDVNLVVPEASSTGELLADLFAELGIALTPELAEPLYTALVTDTGRFQYANTTPKALRLAADLIEAGADAHKVFQGVYETVQFAKLKLLARALERARVYEGGRVVVSYLLRNDFPEVGAAEPYSEGIIDHLRAVEGAQLAALIREPPREGEPVRKVSLRSSVDEIDVSAIARKRGGGGHRQAAGFSSDDSLEDIVRFLVTEFAAIARAETPEEASRQASAQA
jgi:bifunctional oligoribonuclease and PAP phosphatase NrnA